MSNTISGIVHPEIFDADRVIPNTLVYACGNWQKSAQYNWLSNVLDGNKSTTQVLGHPLYTQLRMAVGYIRACCDKITFDYKLDGIDSLFSGGGVVENAASMLHVQAFDVKDNGIADWDTDQAIFQVTGITEAIPWTSVTHTFSSVKNRVIMFSYIQVSQSYQSPNWTWYDWTGYSSEIRNVITEPPSLSLQFGDIGKKQNDITNSINLSLISEDPSSFIGHWNSIPNTGNLTLSVMPIISGATTIQSNTIQGLAINSFKPLVPYDWTFEKSIFGMVSMFSNVGSFEKTAPFTFYAPRTSFQKAVFEGMVQESCMSMFCMRTCSDTIRFETKIHVDCGVVNNPGVDVHQYVLVLAVLGWTYDSDGYLIDGDDEAPYSRGIQSHLDEDWTEVEATFPTKEDRMVFIMVQYVGAVQYPLYTDPSWDGNFDVWVRNIALEPPCITLLPNTIGKREHQISDVATMNLSALNPSWWRGVLKILTTTPQMLLSSFGLSHGIPRNILSLPAEMELSKYNPAYVWDLTAVDSLKSKIIYTMTLTGQASPYIPDIEIPISSFTAIVRHGGATSYELDTADETRQLQIDNLDEQFALGSMTQAEYDEILDGINEQYIVEVDNRNSARPSYLSCVVPNSSLYADEITSRQNGEIIIRKGYLMSNGTRNLEEIVRADFEYLMIYRGSRSDSGTITGYKTRSFNSPKTRRIDNVTYYGVDSSGRKRIRANIDLFLRPNDVCVYGSGVSDYFTVGQITYSVNINNAIMEVVEQDEVFPEGE